MNKSMKLIDKYEELVKAVFDKIGAEYERLYWNKNQKEVYSPFDGSLLGDSGRYENEVFSVHAYDPDWSEGVSDKNFIYNGGDFCATWYKHANRGLYFWSENGRKINAEFINKMLKECLESMREDFKKNMNPYERGQ